MQSDAPCLIVLAALFLRPRHARNFCTLKKSRARGTPGFNRTRGPAWEKRVHTGGVTTAGKAGFVMQRDLARNLSVPHQLGMTTVLVVPEGTREVFREDWEMEGRDAPHVDHVTDNLVGFLRRIIR